VQFLLLKVLFYHATAYIAHMFSALSPVFLFNVTIND